MSFTDDFRNAVRRALGGRTANRAAKEAGLPQRAIATVLDGGDPLLSRGAEIAEAVGLELCIRRKGEPLNPHALRLALMSIFVRVPGEKPERGDYLVDRLLSAYPPMLRVFEATPPEQWDIAAEAVEDAFRAYAELVTERTSPEDRTRFEAARRAGDAILGIGERPDMPDMPDKPDAE